MQPPRPFRAGTGCLSSGAGVSDTTVSSMLFSPLATPFILVSNASLSLSTRSGFNFFVVHRLDSLSALLATSELENWPRLASRCCAIDAGIGHARCGIPQFSTTSAKQLASATPGNVLYGKMHTVRDTSVLHQTGIVLSYRFRWLPHFSQKCGLQHSSTKA